MATWAKGVDFKNSTNTKRIGGIGMYGTDATTNKLYIGLGAEPWNNAGLQLTSSAINFKGNKIYHAGDKPTLSELGAAASSHTHSYLPLSGGTLTGETVFNNYLSLNAWSGYGSGKAQLWYNGTNKQLVIQPTAVTDIIVNNNKVYHAGNKPTPAEIGAAVSSHTHNYAGSSSAGGAATTALTSNYLGSNTRMEYGWNGVNYFNISGTAGNAAKANDTPSTAWWHIMRFNHANSTGYYTDLAIPFNDTSLHYKRITAGSVQNGGWVKILDSLNYNSYAPTKTGTGASGTWGISITGNATTATTLATARTINGTSFNGSANITTANWGTARTITIGSTGKSVNGSSNISWTLAEIGAASTSHTHNYAGSSSAGGAATTALACTGNSATATTLATARTINGTSFNGSANITTANWGTARTITIGNTGKSVNGSANVSWSLSEIGAAASSHSHSNYVSTSDYALTTISKTLTIGTSWMDTGIAGSNLATGSYIVQVSGMDSTATGFYSEIWTGTMSWYNGTTNSTDSDEIVLHKAGHASNGKTIYLRTIRVSSNGTLKLQIAASAALSSTNVTFKFRRLI